MSATVTPAPYERPRGHGSNLVRLSILFRSCYVSLRTQAVFELLRTIFMVECDENTNYGREGNSHCLRC